MRIVCLVAFCLAFASAAPVAEESVTTDLMEHGITADMDLPEAFVTKIMTPEGEHTLRLVRNEKMHRSQRATLYVNNVKTEVQKRDVSYYHATGGESAYVALERREGNLRMSGLLFKRGKLYEISPVEIQSAKRSADEHLHTVKKSAEDLIEEYKQKAAMSIRALPKPVFVEQQEPEPFIPKVIPNNVRDAEADTNEEIPDLPDPDIQDLCDPQLYTVELIFLMDFTMYNYYQQRKADLVTHASPEEELTYRAAQIMNTMDGIYEDSFENTCTKFELKLSEVRVAKTKKEAWYIEDNIVDNDRNSVDDMNPEKTRADGSKILQSIADWLDKNGFNYHNPDHCMAFTKYDLLGIGENPSSCVGLAILSGVCTYRGGVSVIEMTSPHSDIACAHELGHNVGSPHDGQAREGKNCDGTIGNVMGPVVNHPSTIATPNLFLFSSCSRASITAVLMGASASKYPRNCLVDQVCSYNKVVDPDTALGETQNLNQQCKEMTGKEGFIYIDMKYLSGPMDPVTGKQLNFCEALACYNQADGVVMYKSAYWPERGTACGTNKKCLHGKCISSEQYKKHYHMIDNTKARCTDAVDTTPAGCVEKNYYINVVNENQEVVELIKMCSDIALRRPDMCFISEWLDRCCSQCRKPWLNRS